MATQRITVAKVGGSAADVILRRLREWSGARLTTRRDEWSSEQWPPAVRDQVEDFANRLRAHSLLPPVVHFVEWVDIWSMGDLFDQWLTPPDGPFPYFVYANRFQVYGYGLPDGGRLAAHLASAESQQFQESNWFPERLREAVEAWQGLVERAVLVVLRHAVDVSVSDDEVRASLSRLPEWLSGDGGRAAEPHGLESQEGVRRTPTE